MVVTVYFDSPRGFSPQHNASSKQANNFSQSLSAKLSHSLNSEVQLSSPALNNNFHNKQELKTLNLTVC